MIEPSLNGTKHNKVFSIWGDDFAFSNTDYAIQFTTLLSEVFTKHSEEVLGRKLTFKFATV